MCFEDVVVGVFCRVINRQQQQSSTMSQNGIESIAEDPIRATRHSRENRLTNNLTIFRLFK